ncbi:MAG TPA: M55 family metallopeptidase [Anaerolineales bacterium]|nr:M55 family metallopeptidase [Anaerolineales bacterium]
MKILIASDMEGVTGVVNWDQVTPGHPEYTRFRKLMTEDVNAAVRGAFGAGADEVIVADGHWNGSNILIEELDPRARLNSGSPAPLGMLQGIDPSIDGIFFIGYHARQGSQDAVLDHTWSNTCVANVWLNEMIAGEYTLNAALAGHFRIPVLMVSGDQTVCAQAREQIGALETAVVKQATGHFSADCLPPDVSQELIEVTAQRALKNLTNKTAPKPLVLQAPIQVTVELNSSDMADKAMLMPGVRRAGLKLSCTAENMPQAYSAFRALVLMSYPR